MGGWKIGRGEDWKIGRVAEGKVGRGEGWKRWKRGRVEEGRLGGWKRGGVEGVCKSFCDMCCLNRTNYRTGEEDTEDVEGVSGSFYDFDQLQRGTM